MEREPGKLDEHQMDRSSGEEKREMDNCSDALFICERVINRFVSSCTIYNF
jgi:hypothetical protein